MEPVTTEQLMTLSEVSRALGIAESTVRVLADRGQLPVYKTALGRRIFKRGDVEAARVDRARRAAA